MRSNVGERSSEVCYFVYDIYAPSDLIIPWYKGMKHEEVNRPKVTATVVKTVVPGSLPFQVQPNSSTLIQMVLG